ncbi:MAG TPA: LCP family protein [Anaerolineaceae bacterium]|nr:LCP family protein [Anaerolineaceae bacterium]
MLSGWTGVNKLGKRTYLFIIISIALTIIFVIVLTSCTKSAETNVVLISPTVSATVSPVPMPTLEHTRDVVFGRLPRTDFPTPRIAPATAIPGPVSGLTIPDEVRLLVLLGSDNEAPFVSRTNAVMLAFYHPRLAKVSLLSLPPEMFVYIPGYTMQRISVAYAVGGFEMLADTIEYNIGVRPDDYVLVHQDDFSWFVDELNGLDVDVFRNYYEVCGGIPVGSVHMAGKDVFCFVSFRENSDIRDQAVRQQQVVYHLFQNMARGGKLIELSELYYTYRNTVQTNLTLPQLLEYIPLAIRLGQPDRFGFFTMTIGDFIPWQIPGEVSATVLLPNPEKVARYVQDALDFTTIAVQSSDMIVTLEYEMTISPTPTSTYTPTLTPTTTITPTITPTIYTSTITPGGPTLTPSLTLEGYPAQNTVQPTASGYP